MGGAGVAIFGSFHTIESNRIQGGGAVAQGILVYGSYPSIFNNTVLGCGYGTSEKTCYGVKYIGIGSGPADLVGHADSSGGKLYNNTIFAGEQIPGDHPPGSQHFAVYTVGYKNSPEIVNNLLYTPATYFSSLWGGSACIIGNTEQNGGEPASIYNNACITDGNDTCFHGFVDTTISIAGPSSGDLAYRIDSLFPDIPSTDILYLLPFGKIRLKMLFGCGYYFWDCRSAAELKYELDDCSFPCSGQALSGGNVEIDSVFFADIDGPDNTFSTIDDNNWNLTPSTPNEVVEGGGNV